MANLENVPTTLEREALPIAEKEQSKIALPNKAKALEILEDFDGFEELIEPLAENLDRFKPGAESKKKRFLKDNDTDAIAQRQELKDRLQAYIDLLSKKEVSNHKQVRNLAQEKIEKNEAIINENLSNILESARDLEKTYRELELFFRNAQPQKAKNLTLLNINKKVLLDADSNSLYNEVEKRLVTEARKVDQKKAYSILTIPDLWQSSRPKDLIERYAKLAGTTRLMFLTDFADCESVKESLRERESKRWQGVCGSESYHSHLVLFANHLVLRDKHANLEEEEELRGSPCMAVAGKMYAEKISQPIAGEKHGSIANSKGLTYEIVQDEVADFSEEGINALMHAYEKDMPYEACTAFNGSEYALKRYAVVRTFDYVNRVLRHYLGKVTHQQLDRAKSNQVRDTVQSFLDELAEQKIITRGQITRFEWDAKVPDRINLDVSIVPLWAVRTFVYALDAVNGQSGAELKETI